MRRHELTEQQWRVRGPLLDTYCRKQGGRSAANRLFLNAVLWRSRTGIPWRDLPEALRAVEFGSPTLCPLGRKAGLAAPVRRYSGAGLGVGTSRFDRR